MPTSWCKAGTNQKLCMYDWDCRPSQMILWHIRLLIAPHIVHVSSWYQIHFPLIPRPKFERSKGSDVALVISSVSKLYLPSNYCRRRHRIPAPSSLQHDPTTCNSVTPNNDKSSAVGYMSLRLSCGYVVVTPPDDFYKHQIHTFSSTALSERLCKFVYSSNTAKGQIIVHSIYFNSLRPRDAYMSHQTYPSLVQIMAYHMVGTKPLSEPMLPYCQSDHKKHNSVKF